MGDITADRIDRALRYFTELLARHEIWHCICYGTLLGALRDEDIIPWDHDFDLLLRVEDCDAVLALDDEARADGFGLVDTVRPARHLAANPRGLETFRTQALSLYDRGVKIGDAYIFSVFADALLTAALASAAPAGAETIDRRDVDRGFTLRADAHGAERAVDVAVDVDGSFYVVGRVARDARRRGRDRYADGEQTSGPTCTSGGSASALDSARATPHNHRYARASLCLGEWDRPRRRLFGPGAGSSARRGTDGP